MLQKSVEQQKQAVKSTDVLTNAQKWGVQVKPVELVLKWTNEQKKRQATAESTGRVCSLRGAFLKVEDHSRLVLVIVLLLGEDSRLLSAIQRHMSPAAGCN